MTNPSAADQSKAACADALCQLRDGSPAAMSTWLHDHLFGHVLPFWERFALDTQGGFLTCINDDGSVISTEKWLWSQWRAVWVFSRVYRSLDRSEKWLRYARSIAEFCIQHAWDARARHWALLVARDGRILRGYESTHVDGFAVQALTELYVASGEMSFLRLACETADSALLDLDRPRDKIPHFPYPIPPGAKPHAIPMMWSLVFAELGAVVDDPRYCSAAARLSREIFGEFYRADRDLCLEFVRLDGGEFPGPVGTAVVPGHAIEDMWFQIHVGQLLGQRDEGRRQQACNLVIRHLELGWDDQGGGGILLAVDADGRAEVGWRFADTKLWWPLTEALYACLLGWELERSPRFIDWYERIWCFCLDHYVDWQHGEWRQKLTRDLAPLEQTIALPVKDPFHLARSLVLQLELLRQMDGRTNGAAVDAAIAASDGPNGRGPATTDFRPMAPGILSSRHDPAPTKPKTS